MPDEVLDRPALPSSDGNWPIIVHCHLRWDFVWQRPQQLFSRLARRHRVLFLEEPVFEDGAPPSLRISEPQHNIVRVIPVLPPDAGDIEGRCAIVGGLLDQALREHPLLQGQFDSPVEWFYSPMTAPHLQGRFGQIATVYDCMDELANFRFAPADITQREQFLLGKADVVFTGGFELMQAKGKLHRNVHFHGCGVDAEHYGKARQDHARVPDEVAGLPHPVLGYFGVIDERLDYALIARLAEHFSDGAIVMVGPLAKVDRATLPDFPNIHWLGQRRYDELPMLVKSFDVCLMPFAMNEATQYINPTKTLEYMAAGKPIVSTPVPDVVRNFGSIVAIGNDADEFIFQAEKSVSALDVVRIEQGIEMAANASWESIVAQMQAEIDACLDEKATRSPSFHS